MAPLEALQAAVLPPAVTSNLAEIVSLGALLALKALQEAIAGRRREKRQSTELSTQLGEVTGAFQQRCDGIERSVATLSAHVIGPDGENGLRSDVRKIQDKLDDFERRERERLERKVYDRRSAS